MLQYHRKGSTNQAPVTVVLLFLLLWGCAPQGIRPASERSDIDARMTGTWLLRSESRVTPSGRVPAAIRAVHIHEDGRWEAVGVHAASGTLRTGCPPYFRQRDRQILGTDSTGLQFVQRDRRHNTLLPGEGKWRFDGESLHLQLHNEQSGWWNEVYARGALGDTVTTPLRIAATLQLNGTPLPLNEVSSVPPGSVNVMALESETHITIFFDGRMNDSLDAGISIRLHGIDGPGTYPIDTESPTGGMVAIDDPETGLNRTVNRVSAGTVTIDELDLENLRCRGRLDVHFNQEHLHFPNRSQLHLTGGFDLPVWLSDTYDISSTRSRTPGSDLRVVKP